MCEIYCQFRCIWYIGKNAFFIIYYNVTTEKRERGVGGGGGVCVRDGFMYPLFVGCYRAVV